MPVLCLRLRRNRTLFRREIIRSVQRKDRYLSKKTSFGLNRICLLYTSITKRQVASGALPISTGAVVQNVGTAFAVYEAVQKNKPLFERVITVTGKSVTKPSNFLARIGTPMKQLIDACGGLPEDTGKVIGGGPMMRCV